MPRTERMPARMRAKHVKHNLAAIAEIATPEQLARIHAAMGAETVEAIESAPRTAWLDVAHDIRLSNGVAAVLGLEGDRERARRALRISMDGSLLRPLVDGVSRLFGLTPTSILRVSGRGWSAVYKDAGNIRVHEEGERHVRLEYTQVAPEIIQNETYLISIAGALLATFDLCRVEGEVQLRDVDVTARRADFHFRW